MHRVAKHLLARRFKQVPVNDGRKISLILFGGGMTGVRGAGAMIALQEIGLTNAFDEIWVISSGFPNGTGFLCGQARMVAAVYYENLANKKFINFLRFWRIMDINYFMEVLRTVKIFNLKNFFPFVFHLKGATGGLNKKLLSVVRLRH